MTAIVAFLFCGKVVEKDGMSGAVYIYLVLLIVLCLIFLGEFLYGVLKAYKKSREVSAS